MAASKTLVYLPDFRRNTWLLMTKKKQGACLRDYSTSPCEKTSHLLNDLEKMLKEDGSFSESLPAFSGIPYADEQFWSEQIAFRNAESGLSSSIDVGCLQKRFKAECKKALDHAKPVQALRVVFERWVNNFKCVVEKKQFNHWDNNPAHQKISAITGIGWTSQLLELSRMDNEIQYIPTGCEATEFSLVAMELSLGISSKNNKFKKGRTDFIKPDGLALRKNGYFTVIEVKGPQDQRELIGPMLQATCAALALVAKREMLCRIAKQLGKRRPAFKRAEIPTQRRSLGIHVLSQDNGEGGPREPWDHKVERACSAVIEAFPQVDYIAYSFISKDEAKNLRSMRTAYLVTTKGVEAFSTAQVVE